MDAVVQRLEAVTSRLELYEKQQQGRSASSTLSNGAAPRVAPATAAAASTAASTATARHAPTAAPAAPAAQSPASATELVAACEQLLAVQGAELNAAAKALSQEFQASSTQFDKGLRAMVDIVTESQRRSKPTPHEWQNVAADLAAALAAAQDLGGGPRKPSVNHDKAAGECMQGFTWVTYDPATPGAPPPSSAVTEALASADLYLNRVLMEFRQTAPEHKRWVAAVKGVMQALQGVVDRHCPGGLSWHAGGAGGGGSAAPKAAPTPTTKARGPGGPPPPPPPPKPGQFFEDKPSSAGGAGSGQSSQDQLMAALNRGSDVTSGLKKVTADMKTKARADRSGLVSTSEKKPAPTRAAAKAAPQRGPTRKELQQNRWQIENYAGGEPIELAEADVKREHTVYVAHCSDTVIQVQGKVNTIMLDSCKKVGVVFGAVVASLEAVNCQSLQIQCTGACPMLNIDKTDGCQVFLSENCAADTAITTAKASAINITVLGAPESEADPLEHPVPEQFMSKFVSGKLVTTPVTHG